MPGIALSGLASGIDTNSLVSQIMAAEATGRTQVANNESKAEKRVSVLQGIQSKLNALKTATTAMRSVTNWVPTQSIETSDAATLTATRTGGAGAGSYSVNVLGLAASAQKTFSFTSPGAAQTLSFGSTSVDIAAGASLDDAVNAINQAGGDVIAVNAQGKLVVSSNATGAASTFAFSGGALALDSERIGKDATYAIDGGPTQFSASNTIKDAFAGVDVTVKKLGSGSVTVGAPGPDADALTKTVKGFVEAYNAVVDATRAATGEKPIKDARSSADLQKGTLYGDQGLSRMLSSLRERP